MSATSAVRRVLVLDDDAAVGATIGMIVEGAGMEARVTTRYEDFLVALDSWSPSHVTLDLSMPDVDGIEVLRRLAVRGYEGIVIISSGLDKRVLQSAERSALEHGLTIAGYLPKPFRPADLRALLEVGATAHTGGRGNDVAPRPTVSSSALREALLHRRIEIAYQPKVFCSTGAVAGFEALARWRDPEAGIIAPSEFIPLAESERMIDELTDQMVEGSLAFLATNYRDSSLTMSVNLSALSLGDMGLADRIERRCRDAGIDTTRLILELTETSSTGDQVTALDVLTRFRIKGLLLSIDDFGTGHSTLVQLARQPFSEIKIDRQFVMGAMRSVESRTIIRAMVSLGHGLGLRVTAEGVEDEETFAFLRTLGCDLAQGYRIGRPMPADEVLVWMDGAVRT
ncbi:MAG: EAL domain-containing response regulator [Trueperaceae bacterium]|nr:EAL domain-containing response regulator [Trueperaceae bacterium]